MLERIYVDNYRCMVNFECRLGPTQLLLGPNGSGKTSVFDVLELIRDFSAYGVSVDGRLLGLTVTRWQTHREQTFELDVLGNGGLYTYRLSVDEWGRPIARPRVLKEEVYFGGKPLFRFVQGEVRLHNDRHEEGVGYPFDPHRSALAVFPERPEYSRLWWFKRWLSNLLVISPDPRQMSPVATAEAVGPFRNLGNLASWYRHLRQEADDQRLLDDLREAIPGFVGMDLRNAGMGNRILAANFSVEGRAEPVTHTLNELSDGQRVLIGLYMVLHFAATRQTTLLFDEPDNFISLKEIEPWLDRLLDRVEEEESDLQALVISHHPELLNRLAIQSGLAFDRPGGRHIRARPFSDPDQTGLSPAELVARGWEDE